MLLKRTGARRSSYDPELNHVPFVTDAMTVYQVPLVAWMSNWQQRNGA